MNLTTHHLEHPSEAFVQERAATEARLGVRLWKYFMDDAPPQDAPCRAEVDALLAENERLRKGVEEAKVALARAFGQEP